MKYKLIKCFSLLSICLSLVSCDNEEINDKLNEPIKLSIGQKYEKDDVKLEEIDGLTSFENKLNSKESFALVIYDDLGCTCYTAFDSILKKHMRENNTLFYRIENTILNKENNYGINLDVSFPSLCLFSQGELVLQNSYKTSSTKNEFNDYNYLKEYLKDKIINPNIYKINTTILDTKIENNEEMLIYFGRESCPDCRSYMSNVLYPYVNDSLIEKDDLINFYYVDSKLLNENIEQQKEKYGLSYGENNPLGYGQGYVPSIQYRQGSQIKDMDVYLNDLAENEVYYNKNTLNLHSFLNNDTKFIINESKKNDTSYLENFHIEVSNLFLKTYFN